MATFDLPRNFSWFLNINTNVLPQNTRQILILDICFTNQVAIIRGWYHSYRNSLLTHTFWILILFLCNGQLACNMEAMDKFVFNKRLAKLVHHPRTLDGVRIQTQHFYCVHFIFCDTTERDRITNHFGSDT